MKYLNSTIEKEIYKSAGDDITLKTVLFDGLVYDTNFIVKARFSCITDEGILITIFLPFMAKEEELNLYHGNLVDLMTIGSFCLGTEALSGIIKDSKDQYCIYTSPKNLTHNYFFKIYLNFEQALLMSYIIYNLENDLPLCESDIKQFYRININKVITAEPLYDKIKILSIVRINRKSSYIILRINKDVFQHDLNHDIGIIIQLDGFNIKKIINKKYIKSGFYHNKISEITPVINEIYKNGLRDIYFISGPDLKFSYFNDIYKDTKKVSYYTLSQKIKVNHNRLDMEVEDCFAFRIITFGNQDINHDLLEFIIDSIIQFN